MGPYLKVIARKAPNGSKRKGRYSGFQKYLSDRLSGILPWEENAPNQLSVKGILALYIKYSVRDQVPTQLSIISHLGISDRFQENREFLSIRGAARDRRSIQSIQKQKDYCSTVTIPVSRSYLARTILALPNSTNSLMISELASRDSDTNFMFSTMHSST